MRKKFDTRMAEKLQQRLAELQRFLERAQRGDETTLPALRELLKEPHIVEACGNLAAHAEDSLIRQWP